MISDLIAAKMHWVYGLSFSILIGGFFAQIFLRSVRRNLRQETNPHPGVSGWVTGIVERSIFTTMIAFTKDPSGMATAIMAWIAIKMASNWHRQPPGTEPWAFSGLLGSLISIFFAFLGALIILNGE